MISISAFTVVRRWMPSLLALMFGMVVGSCSKSGSVVKWPELRELDTWAEKAEGWNETNNVAEMRKALPQVQSAVKNLADKGPPANALHPKELEQTLADLRDLLTQLQRPNLADEDLKTQLAALHPLVVKLMEQSGVPHVHEHDHGHDH